ncbi:hypothetical protein [Streptomyces sp. NPDC017941]|uniref:hypothetical protein n=1 Tax=Streptomyces sp. NPDC017941 TaxID=3365018 RepID=UPI003795E0D6
MTTDLAQLLQRTVGVLTVDMEGERAKYECLRPGCPHPLEGPVCSTDTDKNRKRRGRAWVASFVERARDYHVSQYHGSNR